MPKATSPLTVTEAVRAANRTVASMPTLVVRGEVTGFRGPHARTGHCYFSVKDPGTSMEVIVWKDDYEACGFKLRDGLEVILYGKFDVYTRTGKLSFKASSLEVAGDGLLRQRVAELARKLEREGLMDDDRKLRVPVFCNRIAVVTSLSGDVIEDVKRTLARRNPLVEITVVGCAVQGATAPPTIVNALRVAASTRPDAILLVRGGGSYEELMCFNDEGVARAIAACPVPVVTGIGHEPDTTIADMVADKRQSTPTAAAESIAPAFNEVERQTHDRQRRMVKAMQGMLDTRSTQLTHLATRAHSATDRRVSTARMRVEALGSRPCLSSPEGLVEARRVQLLETEQRLHDAIPKSLRLRRGTIDQFAQRLRGLAPRVTADHARELGNRTTQLRRIGGRLTVPYEELVARQAATLDALSPLKVLSRGYSVTRDEHGHVVTDARTVAVGSRVSVMLEKGSLLARVEAASAKTDDDAN